jgi:hypothetical protein
MTTFSVAYRSGGTSNATWTRVLEVYPTREAAQVIVAEIERGGRKALIYKTASLDAIGLPQGWEASAR